MLCPNLEDYTSIMEQLQMQRERFGISYIQVPEAHVEKLALVVACLTGR